MRVSLISLLGAVAFVLLAYLIVVMPHPQWRGLVENTLAAVAILMLVAAFAGRHRSRAFGVGFLATATIYLGVSLTPTLGYRDKLFTHHALQFTRQHCVPDAEPTMAFNSPHSDALRIPSLRATPVSTRGEEPVGDVTLLDDRQADENYYFVGHLMWTLCLGFVGGVFGAALVDPGPSRNADDR